MKIFKELKKLGYKHYTEHTIEELDNLPLNSEERIMEQALVLRWFREKYYLDSWVYCSDGSKGYFAIIVSCKRLVFYNENKNTYEEVELECLKKLIEIVKSK